MVLRRTLPSRLTGAPVAESAAPAPTPNVTAVAPESAKTAEKTETIPQAPSAAAALAAASAAAFRAAPAPIAPAEAKPIGQSVDDFISAAPTRGPRVLEESFAPVASQTAAPTSVVKSEPKPEQKPEQTAEGMAPKQPPVQPPVQPAVQPASQPEELKSAPQAAPKPEVQTAPAQPAPKIEDQSVPKPEVQAEAKSTPQPEAKSEAVAQVAAPKTEAMPTAKPTQPQVSNAEPSRPQAGQLRRRVASVASVSNVPNTPQPRPEASRTAPIAGQNNTAPSQSQAKVQNQNTNAAPQAPRIILPTVPKDEPKTAPVAQPAPKPAVPEAPQNVVQNVSQSAVKPEPKPEPKPAPKAEPLLAPEPAAPRASRQVQPRDFAAATIEPAAPITQAAPAPALTLAPEIPVDTRPIDRVDEGLIEAGIMAAPKGDTLTSSLPGSFVPLEETFTPSAPHTPMAPDYRLATGTMAPSPSSGASSSGLPWQAEPAGGGWQLDANTTPPPDVFKPQTPSTFSALPEIGSPKTPPPTLPAGRPSRAAMAAAGRNKGSWLGTGIAVAALGAIGFYVWNQASQPGGLENAKAQLAQFAEPGPRLAQVASEQGVGQGGSSVSATDGALLPPPSTGTGNTQIGFLEPKPDPNAPIAAGAETPMPEDISLFAQLQKAIQDQRVQAGTAVSATAEGTAPDVAEGPITKDQVAAELAAYQQALNENPTNPPRPREFFRDPAAFMDGQAAPLNTASMPEGTLLPPPAGRTETSRADNQLPPPAELYTNNPKNLPIVAEPMGAQAPRVRQLQDFAAELMAPDERRVKIPQGLRPRLSATDFPSLDVLSFVPGKGVVATADGREGVLLIGESINGWELTQVTPDVAEFKAGGRSYYVAAQN